LRPGHLRTPDHRWRHRASRPGDGRDAGNAVFAYVSAVEEIDETKIRVKRLTEEGYEIIESRLPAVINVAKEINIPRLPSLRGKMKAKSLQIPTWGTRGNPSRRR
jgi:electron transfer flavoprotein alpha/beta subunit